ncbi:hypothetical protein KCU92_g302, partial [Aureobasidium melanogenum]
MRTLEEPLSDGSDALFWPSARMTRTYCPIRHERPQYLTRIFGNSSWDDQKLLSFVSFRYKLCENCGAALGATLLVRYLTSDFGRQWSLGESGEGLSRDAYGRLSFVLLLSGYGGARQQGRSEGPTFGRRNGTHCSVPKEKLSARKTSASVVRKRELRGPLRLVQANH